MSPARARGMYRANRHAHPHGSLCYEILPARDRRRNLAGGRRALRLRRPGGALARRYARGAARPRAPGAGDLRPQRRPIRLAPRRLRRCGRRLRPGSARGDGRRAAALGRPRLLDARDHHRRAGRPALFRARLAADARLLSRRGHPLLPARPIARSRVRHVLLGRGARARAQHQRADGSRREPARARGRHARLRARAGERLARGEGAHSGADLPLRAGRARRPRPTTAPSSTRPTPTPSRRSPTGFPGTTRSRRSRSRPPWTPSPGSIGTSTA